MVAEELVELVVLQQPLHSLKRAACVLLGRAGAARALPLVFLQLFHRIPALQLDVDDATLLIQLHRNHLLLLDGLIKHLLLPVLLHFDHLSVRLGVGPDLLAFGDLFKFSFESIRLL